MSGREIDPGWLYLGWLQTQVTRDDPVGDIARLAQRGRRRKGWRYSFIALNNAVIRETRRYPMATKAFDRSINEFLNALLRRGCQIS